jgi:DNA topoisomerase-1
MKILRKGIAPKFTYTDAKGSIVKDKDTLAYLNKLKTPPKYNNVEIYYPANSHKLLYSGIDQAGRQQCIYAPKWKTKAKKQYFCDLAKFGKMLPKINTLLDQLLDNKKFTKNKQIALILRIVTLCHFRVGNQRYEKLYNSHGIATIQKKHIKMDPTNKMFHVEFIGKKGVNNYCMIKTPLIYKIMTELLSTRKPNDYLFTYQDEGVITRIKAVHINKWLKKFDTSFSSKMFRTFSTNVLLLDRMKLKNPKNLTEPQRKKAVVQFMKEVSDLVHNTPCICKKDYANPDLVKMYLEKPRKWNATFADVSSRAGFTKFLDTMCK